MIFDEFTKKYLGKKIDFDGAYGGQCVDLFRQYVKEVLGFPQPKGVVGAKDFWTNYEIDPSLKNYYEKIKNTPSGVPVKGDVVLWDKNAGAGFGHVSIFIDGDVNSFTSFDQNWPTLSKCTKTKHDYKNVSGWLRPKKTEPTSFPKSLKDTVIDFDDAEAKRKTVGFYVYEWFGEKQRALKAEKELEEVRTKDTEVIRQLNEKVRELVEERGKLMEPTAKNALQVLISLLGVK